MTLSRSDIYAYGGIAALGAVLWALCRFLPADMPFFMPWNFSWPAYLATALSFFWFARGWNALSASQRPSRWRVACFVLGVAADYIVLQTHVDYYALHLFYVHRWAHFALHHAAAFFIALGAAGPVIYAGMPRFGRVLCDSWPVKRAMDVMQHPAIAPTLFVGLLYLWLIPSIHTRVMLDTRWYDFMNWTMALNGILFWCLVLDSRPKPPARLSSLMRALMILLIELPQMVLGAILSLAKTDYYDVYSICGRVMAITPISDEHYGGLIIWLPGTLTSFAAMLFVLNALRLNEEKLENGAR